MEFLAIKERRRQFNATLKLTEEVLASA